MKCSEMRRGKIRGEHGNNGKVWEMSKYSVAEARKKFSVILKEAESRGAVTITRRGRPIAVLLSFEEFKRLRGRKGFWEAYERLREDMKKAGIEIDTSVFQDVRDKSSGRTIEL